MVGDWMKIAIEPLAIRRKAFGINPVRGKVFCLAKDDAKCEAKIVKAGGCPMRESRNV
jgi:hypothetical protein